MSNKKEFAENLVRIQELILRMRRIRGIFERELEKNPETVWSPTWSNFSRREIIGYEAELRGQFLVETERGESIWGSYNLEISTDDLDYYWGYSLVPLSERRLTVTGNVSGRGKLGYDLIAEKDIHTLDKEGLNGLGEGLVELEQILSWIGLLSDSDNAVKAG